MIQTLNAAPQPVSMTGAESAPLPAAQPLPSRDPAQQAALPLGALPAHFGDELLESAEVLAEAPVDAGQVQPLAELADSAAAPREPVQEQKDPAALTPELWLLSMLGQQNLQVQAQETPVAQTPAAETIAPLQAQVQRQRQAVPEAAANDAPPSQLQEPLRTARPATDPADALQPVPPQPATVEAAAGATTASERPALSVLSGAHGEAPRQAVDSAAPAARPASLERGLSLHGNEARWGEQMLGALRDSVELQLNQRVQNATIRLDPPELGSLEILLRHESGQLNVQISASQADVARALQGTSERLRQELVGQNFLQVSVQVSADGQQGQGQQHARAQFLAEEAPLAARENQDDSGTQGARAVGQDVLVTV